MGRRVPQMPYEMRKSFTRERRSPHRPVCMVRLEALCERNRHGSKNLIDAARTLWAISYAGRQRPHDGTDRLRRALLGPACSIVPCQPFRSHAKTKAQNESGPIDRQISRKVRRCQRYGCLVMPSERSQKVGQTHRLSLPTSSPQSSSLSQRRVDSCQHGLVWQAEARPGTSFGHISECQYRTKVRRRPRHRCGPRCRRAPRQPAHARRSGRHGRHDLPDLLASRLVHLARRPGEMDGRSRPGSMRAIEIR